MYMDIRKFTNLSHLLNSTKNIKDMASDYPQCNFHGCDIVDVANKEMIPNQLTFQLGNVAQRLPYKDSMFDFVYARLLALALSEDEWPLAIQEILRVTKPGGWIQLVDADVKVKGKGREINLL